MINTFIFTTNLYGRTIFGFIILINSGVFLHLPDLLSFRSFFFLLLRGLFQKFFYVSFSADGFILHFICNKTFFGRFLGVLEFFVGIFNIIVGGYVLFIVLLFALIVPFKRGYLFCSWFRFLEWIFFGFRVFAIRIDLHFNF